MKSGGKVIKKSYPKYGFKLVLLSISISWACQREYFWMQKSSLHICRYHWVELVLGKARKSHPCPQSHCQRFWESLNLDSCWEQRSTHAAVAWKVAVDEGQLCWQALPLQQLLAVFEMSQFYTTIVRFRANDNNERILVHEFSSKQHSPRLTLLVSIRKE